MLNGASNTDLPPRSAMDVDEVVGDARETPPIIPGYDILGYLGRGGMGVVWKARQRSTRREVALKVLQAVTSDRARQRFWREVELSARLTHPNIARVYESGLENGVFYYAMELVNGMPIDQYARCHSLDQSAILRLVLQVCTAVQHAHQVGVIHRDIKPSNLIVDQVGEPRVLDFGLAKAMRDEWNAALSFDGEIAGTPGFMSPEQAQGTSRLTDTRTDVYGLGAVLYLLLTGRLPADVCGSRAEVLHRISQGSIIAPRRVNRRMDKDLEALILKALAFHPDDRYVSAGDLAIDLKNYLSGEPLRARPVTVPALLGRRIRQHRRLVGLTVLLTTFLTMTSLVARNLVDRAKAHTARAVKGEEEARRQSEKSLLAEQAERRVADLQIAEDIAASGSELIESGQWPRAFNRYTEAAREFARLDVPVLAPAIGICQTRQHVAQPIISVDSKSDRYRALFFRSDGGSALAVSREGELVSYQIDGSRRIGHRLTRNPPVWRAGFSTDGRFVAVATLLVGARTHSTSTEITVCSAITFDRLWTQRIDGIANTDLVVLPGGGEIVLGVDSSEATTSAALVRVAAKPSQTKRGRLPDNQSISSVALSNDATEVVSCGGGGLVSVWSFAEFVPIHSLMLPSATASVVNFVSASHEVICGDEEGNLIVWDPAQEATYRRAKVASSPITSLSRSHAARTVLVGTKSGELLNVELEAIKVLQHLCGHAARVTCVALTNDSRFAASCSDDGAFHAWSLEVSACSQKVQLNAKHITSLALSADGSIAAAGTDSGSVVLIDCVTNRVQQSAKIVNGVVPIVSMGFVGSTREIVAADALGRVQKLTMDSPQEIKPLDMSAGSSISVGRRFICGAASNGAQVRSNEEASPAWMICGSPMSWTASSANGRRAATLDANGVILFWHRDEPKAVARYRAPNAIVEIEMSADGTRLLAASAQGQLAVVDPMSGMLQRSWPAHAGRIRCVRFLGRGEQAVTAGDDGEVRLWDVHSGRLLSQVLKLPGAIDAFAISDDGLQMLVASAAEPGAVYLYNFSTVVHQAPPSTPQATQ
jgi:WD40 repeat protein/tRNA A-37 threonylcarbamoyl transferase component Bud32